MSSSAQRGRGRFQPRLDRSARLQQGLSNTNIDSVGLPSLVPVLSVGTDSAEVTNVVALGSYNWVDHPQPTLVIPGNPPMWKEPELPLQLQPDTGESFIDQNAARLPRNPLEPMLRAISVTQKHLGNDFSLANENIDVVTDRNNLRKLLRFIASRRSNSDLQPSRNREFRIDVQLAPNGRTLIFTRREAKTVESAGGFKGYGYSFEQATTEHAAPFLATNPSRTHIARLKPTGYHRIVRYDLLGLRFLVRYEVDAMTSTSAGKPVDADNKDELDTLANQLAQTSLSASQTASQPKPQAPEVITDVPDSGLRHVVYGTLVPQANVLELKTLKSGSGAKWSETYPQLFLSRTPAIKVGKHDDGRVYLIQTYTGESEELRQAHTNLSSALPALISLLTKVREVAKEHRLIGQPFAIYWNGAGDLRIRAVDRSEHLLSEKELAEF